MAAQDSDSHIRTTSFSGFSSLPAECRELIWILATETAVNIIEASATWRPMLWTASYRPPYLSFYSQSVSDIHRDLALVKHLLPLAQAGREARLITRKYLLPCRKATRVTGMVLPTKDVFVVPTDLLKGLAQYSKTRNEDLAKRFANETVAQPPAIANWQDKLREFQFDQVWNIGEIIVPWEVFSNSNKGLAGILVALKSLRKIYVDIAYDESEATRTAPKSMDGRPRMSRFKSFQHCCTQISYPFQDAEDMELDDEVGDNCPFIPGVFVPDSQPRRLAHPLELWFHWEDHHEMEFRENWKQCGDRGLTAVIVAISREVPLPRSSDYFD